MRFFQRHLPLVVAALAVGLILLGVFGFAQTQRELPQRDFTLLTDEAGSGYYRVAEAYREILKTRGVNLILRPTTGSEETLRLLQEGVAGSALVPGFLTSQIDPRSFSSLGALYDEPFWVFYNKAAFVDEPVHYLSQLEGRRVAIGLPGSGSQALALQLLEQSNITSANSTLLELPRQAEAEQLIAGERPPFHRPGNRLSGHRRLCR